MYAADLLLVFVRRWAVFTLGMLATVCAGVWVVGNVGTGYQADGEMILLLPSDASGPATPSNPYINQAFGLTPIASMAATHVMSEDVARELAADGATAEYDVALIPGTGPLLVVTALDTDPQEALDTRDRVLEEISAFLDEAQRGAAVTPSQVIGGQSANVSSRAEVLPGNRLRALAGVVGAGVLLTLLATSCLDRLLRGRRRREQRPRRVSAEEPRDAPVPVG